MCSETPAAATAAGSTATRSIGCSTLTWPEPTITRRACGTLRCSSCGNESGSMGAEGARLPRVLFVIGSLEAGGSESQLVALLERIHAVRVDARLAALVPATDQRLTDRVRAAGIPLVILGPDPRRAARLAGSVFRFVRLVRSTRPALVYPWLEQSALLAAPLARLLGVPVLVARRNVSGPYVERPRPIVSAIHAAERLAVLATA